MITDNEISLSFGIITNRFYFDGTLRKSWICKSIFVNQLFINSALLRGTSFKLKWNRTIGIILNIPSPCNTNNEKAEIATHRREV